jgi:hypothetical protein
VLFERATDFENKNIIINAGLGFDNYTGSTSVLSQSMPISQAGNYSVKSNS